MIPRLHVITDADILAKPDFLHIAVDLLLIVQRHLALHVRGHGLPAARIHEISEALAPKARLVSALLVVNDRLDIALATQAGAIQLGVRSLPVAVARSLTQGRMRIGYSAHSAGEAASAERVGADYILAGTIFPSAGHETHAGTALLSECVERCSVPVLGIGGITAQTLPSIQRTGAYGVAVKSAVWNAPDPAVAAQNLAKLLKE